MRAYCFLLVAVCIALPACRDDKTSLPPLRETYRKSDKQPFGSYIAYDYLKNLYRDQKIENITDPFNNFWNEINYLDNEQQSLFILIAKNLVLDYDEVRAMLEYVKDGNDLFISADYIDSRLLENIDCNTEREEEILTELKGKMQQTNISMYFGEQLPLHSFSYYYYPFLNSLSGYDTSFARVLGVNQENKPNYIVMFSGKGRIYLHVAPRIFGNYFLLTNDNYKYFENVVSYVRSEPAYVYWDEYYKNTHNSRKKNPASGNNNDFSTLSVIWQQPALRWAFLLAIASLLFFIIFNSKRKQREIPVVPPLFNSTLTFTRAVGQLYLQKKNNRHLADKIITYFYDHLRSKYFINTTKIDEDFLNTISRRSGMDKEKTDQLFALIKSIQSKNDVNDIELLHLNAGIEKFKNVKVHGRKFI